MIGSTTVAGSTPFDDDVRSCCRPCAAPPTSAVTLRGRASASDDVGSCREQCTGHRLSTSFPSRQPASVVKARLDTLLGDPEPAPDPSPADPAASGYVLEGLASPRNSSTAVRRRSRHRLTRRSPPAARAVRAGVGRASPGLCGLDELFDRLVARGGWWRTRVTWPEGVCSPRWRASPEHRLRS